jgi:hypothetical protein
MKNGAAFMLPIPTEPNLLLSLSITKIEINTSRLVPNTFTLISMLYILVMIHGKTNSLVS